MNFSGTLHGWYKKNKRDLPWRHTTDPYMVWISEIILQQTRVAQGLDYYLRFAETFPDLSALASASEDQVLLLWQGLGYYSRARNMHGAAKDLVANNGGKMPETYKGLLAMKGVGTYTASAIASICFGEELAVVDGNVARVVARIHGVEEPVDGTAGKRIIDSLATSLMTESMSSGKNERKSECQGKGKSMGEGESQGKGSGKGLSDGQGEAVVMWSFPDPGTHNQAMMEFGALQCVPSSPDCGACPLSQGCSAFLTNRVSKLPVKTPKRKAKDRWMYFYILRCEGEIILSRREGQGIWRSLYLFPVVENSKEQSEEEICQKLFPDLMTQLSGGVNEGDPSVSTVISEISAPIRHQLTHLNIYARFIHINLSSLPSPLPENFFRIPLAKLEDYPVPRLMERYMESAKI